MARFITGKAGDVTVDETTYEITDWSASDSADWQETTNTGSDGYYEDEPGTLKVTGSFNASMDMDAVPAANLAAGAKVALTLKYEAGVTALALTEAGIDSFEVTSEAKGIIRFTCNFHSIGSYSWS
jgi:hypothetical protein